MSSQWRQSNVLVTGATGLLGSHLTRVLVEKGARVVALVRDAVPQSIFYHTAAEWRLQEKVSVARGEVEDYALLERVVNEYEVDTIFHLAAQTLVGTANRSPLATFRANIAGTWNILEAARVHGSRIKRVVVASSDKAYGNLQGEAYDESFPLRGEHPYDVSKSCADLIARSYFVSYGVPVAVTRCGNFFGPGDLNFSRLIPGTIRDAIRGKNPVIRSDGKFVRDYIFAEDGAHAYLTLAEAMTRNGEKNGDGGTALAGEAFNFSYGLKLSVVEVVRSVLETMGRTDLKPEIRNEVANEIPVQALNSDKAKKILNWKPRFGYEDGIGQTVKWYKTEASRLGIL
jgi:CDP-glucose 4,6-dehydratase